MSLCATPYSLSVNRIKTKFKTFLFVTLIATTYLFFRFCNNIVSMGGMFKSYIYFTTLYSHIPLYRTSNLAEQFHRIPITARKHTDFRIDSILINVRNHTINGIISLHKFFLQKIFFPTSFLFTGYIILNITLAINDIQCLFSFDKSIKKDYIR